MLFFFMIELIGYETILFIYIFLLVIFSQPSYITIFVP